MSSWTIGELAAKTGVSVEAIRFYEREGVIPRAVRDGAGQYRRYGSADAERLRFIRHARDLGFSLDDVRELLSLADGGPTRQCSDVNRIARSHLAEVERKLARLEALRRELHLLIDKCDEVVPVAECRILAALSESSSS